ncbi:hypothetical protein QYE76_056272 [Lolium multiflorum]|uniref:Retrotransposon gag domain-containing protein n=1 Tax=Lolium multiflorum TaxID=4521 RepID=A0AAD8T1C0_LOLMU|nr:hypothetical protein QYE76_056272 [Lolium multiflorum]
MAAVGLIVFIFSDGVVSSFARSQPELPGQGRTALAAARRRTLIVVSLLLSLLPFLPGRKSWRPSINFNQFLEKEKLKSNGSNFTDWFRHEDFPQWKLLEAELQKRFEHHDRDMINELKVIFETHAAVESYEASKQFFGCMMEEGSSVSEHVFAMSGHAKKLSDLGIVIPNQLGIHRVLQSLPPSYKNFVMNYNMQNMNKELPELFSMLKSAEVEIRKENQVLMVNKTTDSRSWASLTRETSRRAARKLRRLLRSLRLVIRY